MERNATRREITGPNGYAANLTPFIGHNLSGIAGPADSYGRMDNDTRSAYRAHADAGNIRFTVISYATPVAWVLVDGTVESPASYSVTTKKQMSSVLPWLGSAVTPQLAAAA